MKKILFILISAISIACTKIEEGVINTDSTPYSFKSLNIFTGTNKNALLTYYSFPHPKYNLDYLYQTIYLENDERKIFRFFSTYMLGYPHIKVDQSNFLIHKYKDAKSIFQLDVFDDFNSNGFMDEVFQIEYEDSSVFQIRDHFIGLNPKSKYDIPSAIWKKFTITKEDYHNIRYLFLWKPTIDKSFLVVSKDNRITRKKYLDLDSLLFIDIKNDKIIRICSEVPLYFALFYNTNINLQKEITLISGVPKNGHNWSYFKDYNKYFFKFIYDEKKDRINTKYLGQLTDFSKDEVIVSVFEDGNYLYIIRNTIDEKSRQVYNLEKYDANTGNLVLKNSIDWNDGFNFMYFKVDNEIKFLFDDEVLSLDLKKMKVTQKKLEIPLHLDYDVIGLNPINLYSTKDLRLRVDVNGNVYNDIFITTQENQLVCIDGKTNQILAASKKYPHIINWCVGRVQNGKVVVFIYYKDFTESFILKPNSFITRLNVYIPTIVAVILVIGIPVLLHTLYRFYLTNLFLYIFTNKNRYLGIAIIVRNLSNKNYRISKSNPVFREILDLPVSKKQKFSDLTLDLQNIISKDLVSGNSGIYNLTLNFEEKRFIVVNTFIIKPFLSRKYCILTIQNETPVIKSQIAEMYVNFVHKSKNALAIMKIKYDDLIYDLQKHTSLDEQIIEKKQSIKESILSLSKSMQHLLTISKPNLERVEQNFAKVVNDWCDKNFSKYQVRDVIFVKEINEVGDYQLNRDSIYNILECAVTNSVQAKNESKPLIIKILLTSDDKNIFLEIHDNGIGMSEDFLNKVTNWNSVTQTKGTGLGLKYIKNACEKHNADLVLESKLDYGTILRIIFKKEIKNGK